MAEEKRYNQNPVVQPLLTGKSLEEKMAYSLIWALSNELLPLLSSEHRFIPNHHGVRVLEIWQNQR